jgi:DNA-binding NtrC family response regulator
VDETKGTILVVDDNHAVRTVVARKMQAEGYVCVTATNGREALEKVAAQPFDLILLDMMMPGPSGMEVLLQITKDHPRTGVVMMTAVVDTQTAVEAMKLGAFDYVTKPFNLDDLTMRVENAFKRKRPIKEDDTVTPPS